MTSEIVRTILLGLLFAPVSAAAQFSLPIPVMIEARAGYASPTSNFASGLDGSGVEGGPSFAIGGRVAPIDVVGIYLGYQETRFGCPRCERLGLDDSIVARGLETGLHLSAPVSAWPVMPWVRGGIVRQTLGFRSGEDRMTSAAGVGMSGAVGVSSAVSSRFDVTGGFRYLASPADFRFTIVPERSIDVGALSADIGVTFRF